MVLMNFISYKTENNFRAKQTQTPPYGENSFTVELSKLFGRWQRKLSIYNSIKVPDNLMSGLSAERQRPIFSYIRATHCLHRHCFQSNYTII